MTEHPYMPLYFEVHVDFESAGISTPKVVKYRGKKESVLLVIDPRNNRIAYHTLEKHELIWGNDLGGAYHCDNLAGAHNGFVIKFRGNDIKSTSSTYTVHHILSGCPIDKRADRDILVKFLQTVTSKDGLRDYFLEKYYKFPKELIKGVFTLKDDNKKECKVVTTWFNTVIFASTIDTIPRHALLHSGWEVTADPRKSSVTFTFQPDEKNIEYKTQKKEWDNEKQKIVLYAQNDKETVPLRQHVMLGPKNVLATAQSLPTSLDSLRNEMFEKQNALLLRPTSQSTAQQHQPQPTQTMQQPRRETMSLEQQTLQHQQQRQRASALPTNSLDLPSQSPSSRSSSQPRRSAVTTTTTVTKTTTIPKIAPIDEDFAPPPPPPPADDDLPPPPPPDIIQAPSPQKTQPTPPQSQISPHFSSHQQSKLNSSIPLAPPPDDDDDLPPPPPGMMMNQNDDLPPPPAPFDDDDDDEPPPPTGVKLTNSTTSKSIPANQFQIQNELTLQPITPTSRNNDQYVVPSLPPKFEDTDDDMPPPSLAKNLSRTRADSAYRIQQLRIEDEKQKLLQQQFLIDQQRQQQQQQSQLPPTSSDIKVRVVDEGDQLREIRTETITDHRTGEITTTVTEIIRPRAVTRQSVVEEAPLPPTPCPVGCHYKFTDTNPLRRKCQLYMDDALLGVLDVNFKLPFTSTDGEPVYGVLPDDSCDLDPNFLITTNGLIVECRVDGFISPDDSVLAQVKAETALFLLARRIAAPGQTLTFLAQGCVPGSEIEMERFMPGDDEEVAPPTPQSPITSQPTTPQHQQQQQILPPPPDQLPPTPILTSKLPPGGLSIDLPTPDNIHLHPNAPTPTSSNLTPHGGHHFAELVTPTAQPTAFHFGAAQLEISIKIEGNDEPHGVIEIPSDANPSEYTFLTLRQQMLEELEDLPDEFVFLIKGAKLTAKQEPKKPVASLSEPIVIIRDVKKYEQQKQAEEENKRQEEERKQRLEAQRLREQAPPRQAPSAPPRQAPIPPPGAPRGVAPTRPPPSNPNAPQQQQQQPQQQPQSQHHPLPQRPGINAALFAAGAAGLKKSTDPHPSQGERLAKPPDFLSEIKSFKGQKALNKLDHAKIAAEKQRAHRGSLAGGMFVSLKAAMATRRAAVDDVAEDSDQEDWE